MSDKLSVKQGIQPTNSCRLANKHIRRWCLAPARYRRIGQILAAIVLNTVVIFGYKLYIYRSIPILSTATWQDNVWPLKEQELWDISADFPHPRTLSYHVSEGTWLRLDVHPKNGDIVFDMLGDLYCISAYSQDSIATARPILRGPPHDSDPHFSPDGTKMVFRSDTGQGIENIWVMEYTSCKEMEQSMQKASERLYAQRVTNETFRWVSDARFHPSGTKVIATKWYTSGRSLGAGEGWQYDVSAGDDLTGSRVLGRRMLPGWTIDDYSEQQIGPEQFIWYGEDSVIFSKNIRDEDHAQFEYSKDIHKGIYSIFSYNLTTKHTEKLVDASPGGASRPELSRDGRTLAFVRRARDNEYLVLKDLHTGTIHYVWDGLSYDVSAVSAPMGTYPSFAFSPDDSAVIIWAAGQIYNVPLAINYEGEKVGGGTPYPIKFTAHILKNIAETRTIEGGVDLVGIETADTQRVYAFKELRVDEYGDKVVFQAAGESVIKVLGQDGVVKVPVLHDDGITPYYSPSFVPFSDRTLVIHARWSDTNFTSFEIADVDAGKSYEIEGLPFGRFRTPVVGTMLPGNPLIAFVKTGGDYLTGDIVATAGKGLYIGELNMQFLPITIQDLHFVPTDIDLTDEHLGIRFIEGSSKLLVQQTDKAFVIDLHGTKDITGKPVHRTLATGRMSREVSVSTASKSIFQKLLSRNFASHSFETIAFVDSYNVYVVSSDKLHKGEAVWSKPANATDGLARVSLDGGHDIAWSEDGKKLFWFLGPYLHSLEISKLAKCSSEIKKDTVTFGISCVKNLLDFTEIVVEHSTDIARLKQEAKIRDDNGDIMVIYNATLLTMKTGKLEEDLIPDGILVTKGGVIVYAGPSHGVIVPESNTAIDAQGGFIIPGFIDVHAHWYGFSNPTPAKSWELETFLAYGVTTLHNPSADNVNGFVERSRLERGHFVGPRIFQTGDVVYGAGIPTLHQDIVNIDDAYSALLRIKVEGGPISTSYKNYNLPSRASRQRLLLQARNLKMLCVPEGGMNLDWDLTYIADGMTTVEHSIPISVLYDDIITFFALSGTGNTPTHLVNYGGAFGEQYLYWHHDIPNDPKLRTFLRHDFLVNTAEVAKRPVSSYAFFNTSSSVAKMVKKGMKAHIGAHGENPMGLAYHAEMWFTKAGGLSNYETLQAATSWAASTLAVNASIGSLGNGMLADFLVYPQGVDILNGDLKDTLALKYVVRGGRMWNASTMEQVWPTRKGRQTMPPLNP